MAVPVPVRMDEGWVSMTVRPARKGLELVGVRRMAGMDVV